MIKKLLELAKESIGKDESILEYILKFIRDNNAFEELGEDCHVQLIEMLPLVKEMTTKAQLIETIVECPNYISDSVLFDEYISLISQGATTIEDAVRGIGAFGVCGTSEYEIFAKLAENLDREIAIKILVLRGNCGWGNMPIELKSFMV